MSGLKSISTKVRYIVLEKLKNRFEAFEDFFSLARWVNCLSGI
jgi:hypothetical protein